jgi:aspartate/glutamate racemase
MKQIYLLIKKIGFKAAFCPMIIKTARKLFLKMVMNIFCKKGAKVVIVGCTDIRVEYCNPQVIDSLEVLANTIFKITRNGQ